MYLLALNLSKEEFVAAVGLIWFCGSIPLVVSYAFYGILRSEVAIWSGLAIVPTFMGMLLGQWIRRQVNQITFRKILLCGLALLGINLVRRAFL
jgi:uncharacterized membrane protein YfcA